MGYLLSSLIIMINTLIIGMRKKSKPVAVFTLIFMWILYWGNFSNPDYTNYSRMYYNMAANAPVFTNNGAEFGYRLLMKASVTLNIEYEIFLAIISFICILLIHSTIKKFINNYNLVYIAYFIFPFFLDIVQIRNFIVMAVFIFSVRYLFESTKYSRIKYLIAIIVGSTIHYIALFYLPMVIINLKNRNRAFKAIMYFSIVLSLLILINNKQIPFLTYFAKLMFKSEKVLSWTDSKTSWGFLLYWFSQFFSFYLISLIRKSIKKDDLTVSLINDKQVQFVEIVYMINIVAFLYMPFYLLASTFSRLMRNILILNYASISIFNSKTINNRTRFKVNLISLIYIIFLFISQLYIPFRDSVIKEIIENNLIIK